jgi:hypothetical protein
MSSQVTDVIISVTGRSENEKSAIVTSAESSPLLSSSPTSPKNGRHMTIRWKETIKPLREATAISSNPPPKCQRSLSWGTRRLGVEGMNVTGTYIVFPQMAAALSALKSCIPGISLNFESDTRILIRPKYVELDQIGEISSEIASDRKYK